MKLSPINSNPTQISNNFKGRFIFNTAMREIVESSGKTELARFKNVLNAMEKIDDGLYFGLHKRIKFYELNNQKIGYVVNYKIFKQNGNDETTQEFISSISSGSNDIAHNKLSLISKAIEDFYLKIAEKDSKSELKDCIYNIMA